MERNNMKSLYIFEIIDGKKQDEVIVCILNNRWEEWRLIGASKIVSCKV